MLDPNELLRDPTDAARRLGRKGVAAEEVEAAVAAIRQRRALRSELDELRGELNRASKEVGELLGKGDREAAEQRKAEVAAVSTRVRELEQAVREVEAGERDALMGLPNWPAEEAPEGSGEQDNVVLSVHGPSPESYEDFPRRAHWEVGEELGIYDGERGAKISGSMFALLRKEGSRLLNGLVQYGLALNRARYEEITPPHLVRTETFTATGHLPKFARDAYQTTEDGLWLIPTGEVPLMSIHRDEVLAEEELPKQYMAYTVCFRREAGSAGKDTRGMQRLHEFHKVELVKLCTEEQAQDAFSSMLQDVLRPLEEMGLTYRVVDLCAGDLTFSSARIFDVEVYAPGVRRWLEVSSVGQFTDFQARRGGIRYRPADGGRPRFVHALNGSALATPRVWAAVVEVGQQPDGSIRIPGPLVPYMGQETIPAR
jgi:seryl-tRNA synthetase